jgi:hypothetical protein
MMASITGVQSNGAELSFLVAAPTLRGIRVRIDKLRLTSFTNLFIYSILWGFAKALVSLRTVRMPVTGNACYPELRCKVRYILLKNNQK